MNQVNASINKEEMNQANESINKEENNLANLVTIRQKRRKSKRNNEVIANLQ